MEAQLIRAALFAAAVSCLGASHRTQNFISTAPTQQLAVEIGEAAERYRRDLAIEWLGAELPPWGATCPITSQVGPHLGAGGATSFMFDHGRPFGWTMNIQGSRERLLDSVLPHEVTHTIFATHFGRPLPRWADEGACTTVEHVSERKKQKDMLVTFLTTNRGIAFNKMFAMTEYPHDVMPLYSQGYSLARYLIAQGGKRKFIAYVGDGMNTKNWTAATQKHYGFSSLSELQVTWLDWVRKGSPDIKPSAALAVSPEKAREIATVSHDAGPSGPSGSVGDAKELVSVSPPDDFSPPAKSAGKTSLASSTKGLSWYAKQRDLARPSQGAASDDESQSQTLTRPQPLGRPEQRILEWDRSMPSRPVRSP